MPETNEEYCKHGGGHCPYCGSVDITGGSIQIDAATAWQTITCSTCEKQWTDIYSLTEYEADDLSEDKNKLKTMRDTIEHVLNMADNATVFYEERGFLTTKEIALRAIAIEQVRGYFEKLQKNLKAAKEAAQTICIPKTVFTYADWAETSASAKTIEKLIDDLLLEEDA